MEILSPLPGTFYRKPSPDEPAYVEVGQTIKAGQPIGLVEIMKQYTELTAEADGVIDTFHIEDGEPVEPGQLVATLK